ncbi:MAG: aminopeptidase, partial [Thermotoga sp.]
ILRYTGRNGKFGASEARAEFVGKLRILLNENGVIWQAGELGKVDVGGGGTVAKFFAELGMDVVDMGPPVLSMHSPYELLSKADLHETIQAYRVFLEKFS